jgi:hypothetical protein
LVAPANAVEPVKMALAREGGYVSDLLRGEGVADGLRHVLAQTGK